MQCELEPTGMASKMRNAARREKVHGNRRVPTPTSKLRALARVRSRAFPPRAALSTRSKWGSRATLQPACQKAKAAHAVHCPKRGGHSAALRHAAARIRNERKSRECMPHSMRRGRGGMAPPLGHGPASCGASPRTRACGSPRTWPGSAAGGRASCLRAYDGECK